MLDVQFRKIVRKLVFVNEMVYSTSGLTALQNSQMRLANSLGESPGIGMP